MNDSGIIRNRMKIQATIANAKAFNNIRKSMEVLTSISGSLLNIRQLKTTENHCGGTARSRESDMMSKDLIRRGFKFVGSTICYAYMQAAVW
jgi:DNA-3-methyladenine glycosylase I